MIRTETEYREARMRLEKGEETLKSKALDLRAAGRTEKEIKRVLDPSRAFQAQVRSEVQTYERLKQREFGELKSLRGLGQLLIALRIAGGLSQCELAERLGVHESQVSRDERNEYAGITVDRAVRVLDALGADVSMRVDRLGEYAKAG